MTDLTRCEGHFVHDSSVTGRKRKTNQNHPNRLKWWATFTKPVLSQNKSCNISFSDRYLGDTKFDNFRFISGSRK